MKNILVVNYASRMAKAFADEKAALQYADEKVELWGYGYISVIGFVDERSLEYWVEKDFTEDWVVIR